MSSKTLSVFWVKQTLKGKSCSLDVLSSWICNILTASEYRQFIGSLSSCKLMYGINLEALLLKLRGKFSFFDGSQQHLRLADTLETSTLHEQIMHLLRVSFWTKETPQLPCKNSAHIAYFWHAIAHNQVTLNLLSKQLGNENWTSLFITFFRRSLSYIFLFSASEFVSAAAIGLPKFLVYSSSAEATQTLSSKKWERCRTVFRKTCLTPSF